MFMDACEAHAGEGRDARSRREVQGAGGRCKDTTHTDGEMPLAHEEHV